VTQAPGGLHGVCHAAADDGEGTASDVAIVLARAAGARRLLRIGEPLVKDADAVRLTTGRQARNDTTLAVLALAGQSGLPDAELFEAVYGFAFVPARHDGVLGVLLHRVRQRLADGGVVEREGGHVRLHISAPLVVVDPRCTRTVDDRVLHIVAESGRADARTAARRLGLPLRTVQGALAQLVNEGVCRRERSGRHIEYVVEDTTFMEPTRA
jgi:hypothetical protein